MLFHPSAWPRPGAVSVLPTSVPQEIWLVFRRLQATALTHLDRMLLVCSAMVQGCLRGASAPGCDYSRPPPFAGGSGCCWTFAFEFFFPFFLSFFLLVHGGQSKALVQCGCHLLWPGLSQDRFPKGSMQHVIRSWLMENFFTPSPVTLKNPLAFLSS